MEDSGLQNPNCSNHFYPVFKDIFVQIIPFTTVLGIPTTEPLASGSREVHLPALATETANNVNTRTAGTSQGSTVRPESSMSNSNRVGGSKTCSVL